MRRRARDDRNEGLVLAVLNKQTVADLPDSVIRGRRALVRVDFNVPLDEHSHVSDDTRIRAALPTLEYLAERGARVIVLSHLGRPQGKPELKYSLEPVSRHVAGLTKRRVRFVETTDTDEAMKATLSLPEGRSEERRVGKEGRYRG